MTLISTACSWVNMFGGHKAAIFTQVGQFYFGRWVSFSSAVTLVPRNAGKLLQTTRPKAFRGDEWVHDTRYTPCFPSAGANR